MSEQIKVGDLVLILGGNGCSCAAARKELEVGKIFTVVKLASPSRLWCICGLTTPVSCGTYAELSNKQNVGCYRLKRIPPLKELQTYRRTEETTA